MKRQNFKDGEQKSQTAKSERKLVLRRGYEEICFKERRTIKERKGATKTEQKKHNENVISKGVMKAKEQKYGILKGITKEKKR